LNGLARWYRGHC